MGRVIEAVLPARLGRGFRQLLAASWVMQIGDGIALAAGPLLVASQTHDPLLVAMAPLLQQLPWLIFGLYAGALADRLDRKAMVVVANLCRAVVLAVLIGFLATGTVSIAVVLGAVFLLGIAETFADTTATTLLPMLVPKADLGVANSRLFAGFITINQLAGPPLGAAIFAVGMVWPFTAQLAMVLLAVLMALRITLPPHGRPAGERPNLRRDVAEGVRWLWHHDAVRTLAIVMVTFNITFGAAWSVLVLYATRHLGMSEVGFGLLTTTTAVGGLIATTAYGWLERHVRLGTLMKACLTLEVFVHLGLALANRPWMAFAIMLVFGAYAFVWGTLSQAVRQRAVPMEFQGRVSSVYLVAVFGGIVVGNFLGGLIARQWGLTAPFWFAFVGTGLFLVAIWRSLDLIAHADEAAQTQSSVEDEAAR